MPLGCPAVALILIRPLPVAGCQGTVVDELVGPSVRQYPTTTPYCVLQLTITTNQHTLPLAFSSPELVYFIVTPPFPLLSLGPRQFNRWPHLSHRTVASLGKSTALQLQGPPPSTPAEPFSSGGAPGDAPYLPRYQRAVRKRSVAFNSFSPVVRA